MNYQRGYRFYARGNTGFEVFRAFREALEKMAGHRLGERWYDDDHWKEFYDDLDRKRAEGREGE